MAAPGANEREDPHIALFLVCCALYIGWLIFSWFFAREINIFSGLLSWVIIKPFALLGSAIGELRLAGKEIGRWITGTPPFSWILADAVIATGFLERTDIAAMTPQEKNLVLGVAGRCFSLIAVPALIMLAFSARKLRPDETYRGKHTLDSMIFEQSRHWTAALFARIVNPAQLPEIDPRDVRREKENRLEEARAKEAVSGLLRPAVVPIAVPKWGRPLRPEEWLDAQGIDWSRFGCEPDDVDLALASQLRTVWRGWDSLNVAQKAIAAAMVLFNSEERDDKKASERLIDDLSLLFYRRGLKVGMLKALAGEKELVKRINAILASPKAEPLKEIADRHAWVETAMVAMFETRRGKGVLAAARFLWLRTCDRTLWTALQDAGSNVCSAESAGILAHYRAERQFGFPIAQPYVHQATRALILDYLDLADERVEKRRKRLRDGRSIAEDVREEVRAAQIIEAELKGKGGS